MEAKRTCFLWLLVTIHVFSVVAVVASLSGFYSDNGFDQTVMHKELSHRAKREVQQEILHLLGLHHRPRPNFNSAHGTVNPAPRFLLDVYRSFTEEDSGGLKLEPELFENEFNISRNDVLAIDQSDLIMSFVNHGHQLRHHHRDSVFWFDLSEIARNTFPLNAELRVYLKHLDAQSAIYDNLSGIVLRVHRFLGEDRDVVEEEISMDQLNEGWVALNVTKALQSWMVSPEANKGLRLTAHHVSDGEINVQDVGIVGSKGEEDLQSFMVGYFRLQKTTQDAEEEENKPDWTELLNLQQQDENVVDDEEDEPRRLPSRRRRAANGTGNNKRRNGNKDVSYADDTTAWNPYSDFDPRYARRSCQKKNLYVSFRDLGWHDWIIAPDGYAAFYCNGECSFPLNAHMNASNHAIVQTLVHLMNPYQYPKPCCAPIKLSSISVLYFDDTSNVILKKYRNMVVKSCGCH